MDNQADQGQITGRFFEFYGKKAFTADVQSETITRLKAENERLANKLAEKEAGNDGSGEAE